MEISNTQKVAGIGVVVLVAFASGYYLAPVKVVEKVKPLRLKSASLIRKPIKRLRW